jgi:RNA polymerase-binding transcription factor DksA
MNCIKCGVRIPAERLALVNTDRCVKCSDTQAYKGMLSFSHKTGGAVQPMQPDTYRAMKNYTSRRGKRSNLGSFFGNYSR